MQREPSGRLGAAIISIATLTVRAVIRSCAMGRFRPDRGAPAMVPALRENRITVWDGRS